MTRGEKSGRAGRTASFGAAPGRLAEQVERWLTRDVRDAGTLPAPVSAVWHGFSDFGRYPDWNPFIREASGRLRVGSRLELRLRLGARTVRFRPLVTWVEAEREVRWRTRVLIPGLFDVDRRFRFEASGPDQTRFVQEETNRGLLVPLAYALLPMEGDLRTGFREFREALGWLAGGKAAAPPAPAESGARREAGAAAARAATAR